MMEIRNLFHKAGSKWPTYGIQRKNKKQILRNSRKTTREEYTLDWSQSKVFLVNQCILCDATDACDVVCEFRVWSLKTGDLLNTLIHHCEAVLHLRFSDGIMVTCSKVRLHTCHISIGQSGICHLTPDHLRHSPSESKLAFLSQFIHDYLAAHMLRLPHKLLLSLLWMAIGLFWKLSMLSDLVYNLLSYLLSFYTQLCIVSKTVWYRGFHLICKLAASVGQKM